MRLGGSTLLLLVSARSSFDKLGMSGIREPFVVSLSNHNGERSEEYCTPIKFYPNFIYDTVKEERR